MSASMIRKAATARVAAPRVQAVRPVVVRGRRVITCAAVDKEKVLADVRVIIAEQLGTELEKIQAESKFVDLGADSLDTVEIMMALEEKFDVSFEEENTEKISTVQQAADMIAGQIASK
ncbi:hypothetical protein VOLCADRAFT_75409 [Volvox carteri f. nagariensis]|uniref:Acyl carrier protein n=1 Tax=Volvox carteri f. nagariensis TaxID=3068 RepID=D8U1L7_VOLCA|nr:uncharacterized protein VOLCADRAFT_75409 [Volvox carteri f. nagariensis]EFJ46361.1 hypothetical protein VOLCADRAFT_75409 [Volvox carteri f. nagariensis]|eukprot:XP_002952514.1 hypothetical protein VOLCADRAFT_75409 [Volvox carteri f. nagariensis]